MRSRIFFYLALFFFACISAKPLFADFRLLDSIKEFGEKRIVDTGPARLKAGPVRLHPSIKQDVTYDSNILLEDKDAREDVVFNISPGAIVELPFQKHQFAFGYEAEFEIFSKERHAKQNDQNQNFFALVDLQFTDFYINFLEQLKETSGRSGTTFTERVARFDQSAHPKIGFRWRRAIFEAFMRHFVRDFRRQVNDRFDFQQVEWGGVFYYDLFAKLKALLNYQVGQIDYDDDFERKTTFHETRLGLDGEILRNLRVKMSTGVQFRNSAISSEPDFNSWVADGDLEYEFRKNILWTAGFSRVPREATFADVNFYKETSVRTGLEYIFLPRWSLYSQFRYSRQRYAERATLGNITAFRRDHLPSVRTGLKYRMVEWLEMDLYYEFLKRISNFETQEYNDHRVALMSTLSY